MVSNNSDVFMARPSGTFVIPMTHPSKFFRNQTNQFTALLDWEKAVRIQKEGPTIVHPPFEDWQWRPTFTNLEWYFRSMLGHRGCTCGSEWDGPWSIDFEATVDRRVVCCGIWSTSQPLSHKGLCIPLLSQGGVPYWTPPEEHRVLQYLHGFFTDALLYKIGQNTVGYDTGFPPFHVGSLIYQAWGVVVRGILGDTMAAHHTCFSELKHGLAFLTSVSTDMSPYKEELWDEDQDEDDDDEKDWTRILDRPDERVRKYNLKDAFGQAVVWNGMVKEMGKAYV